MTQFTSDIGGLINYISTHKKYFIIDNIVCVQYYEYIGEKTYNEFFHLYTRNIRFCILKTSSINYKTDLIKLSQEKEIWKYFLGIATDPIMEANIGSADEKTIKQPGNWKHF